jgi:dTDP-4-dehydrorhamnose reductase
VKILVTGANGQLGWELSRCLQPLGEVIALDRRGADLAQPETLPAVVAAIGPDVIVNAAAYTAVDRAETEEDLATRINGTAVGVLARAARARGALFLHYSTDYVFPGDKSGTYLEDDVTSPLNAYGRSKRAGEEALLDLGGDWLTLRTTWVYAARGGNFLRTMLRLAQEREVLRVVADQVGAPTTARWLAETSAFVVDRALDERRAGTFRSGIYHCSAAGQASWFEFAEAIIAGARKRLDPEAIRTVRIEPIGSSEYPLPARRPHNSLLDMTRFVERFALHRTDWHESLELVLDEALGSAAR